MFNVGTNPQKNPALVEVAVDKAPLQMQVDTVASVCIISYSTYAALWENQPQIKNCPTKLRTYTGEEIEVIGNIIVTVSYKNVEKEMPPIIVKGDGPSLFGRDWLLHIPLDWKEIAFIQAEPIKYLIANILI